MNLSQLVAAGYTAMDILETIFGKQPKQLNKIKKLVSYGYAPATILSQLAGGKNAKEEEFMTSEERIFAADEAQRNKFGKLLAAGIGAAAGSGGLLSLGDDKSQIQMQTPQERMLQPAQPKVPMGEKFSQYAEQLPEELTMAGVEELIRPEKKSMIIDFESSFPELHKATEKMIAQRMKPEDIYDKLVKSRLYSPLIKRYEELEGESYLDKMKQRIPQEKRTKTKQDPRQDLYSAISELRKLMEP